MKANLLPYARRALNWLAALAIVGAILGAAFVTLAVLRPPPEVLQFEATDVTGVAWGRDFRLDGNDGKAHELADFRGKVVAVYFGYTRCPDVCPLTLATLAEATRLLGSDAERVQGVFVTVDPRHDSPTVLARYVHSFDERLLGLYGSRKTTAGTLYEFKIEGGKHHSIPVFLFDPHGRLRLVARPDSSAESLAHDMRVLLKGGAA